LNRRWFSIGVAAAIGTPFALRASPPASAGLDVRGLFSAPDSAACLGRAYLRLHPLKADCATLIGDITLGDGRHASGVPLARLVGEWQRRDFEEGRIVILDRWVLTLTEVSLCALLALG
jgi:hypothetical protein